MQARHGADGSVASGPGSGTDSVAASAPSTSSSLRRNALKVLQTLSSAGHMTETEEDTLVDILTGVAAPTLGEWSVRNGR